MISAVAILGAGLYWSVSATDRYVSEATVVLQSAEGVSTSTFNVASLLSGGSAHDLLMLREYLLSVDMLQKLDAQLDLRAHYANKDIDILSRLESVDVPLEYFHRYYLKRVSVEMDEYANVLRIRAQAYDPKTSHAIVSRLLREGEAHMNKLGRRLAGEQVKFIEVQVKDLKRRLDLARDEMLAYQNTHGLISPTATVQSLSAVVATLQGELAKLDAHRRALGASQSKRSPEMVRLSHEISALRSQIEAERTRMAAHSGNALNRLAAEFETLRLQVEFAQEVYTSALAALENTRVQAARSLKQVSILQSPTMPEYSMAPKRLYNITVFTIMAILAALIAHLLVAIVRDHRD
ncbi:chain-length determining protein [Nitrococcus mobilis]|uniref:chain-length determining protein n=1 Tax=Nitrococcus mobilis TaxID=35797 RepID=UPI001E47FD71|nr:chain-length determining protein [Nitrococcus mobilis]